MISFAEFRTGEFYSFFNLTETRRVNLSDDMVLVNLKTGGFREYININVVIDEKGIIRGGVLALDRDWIGNDQNVNPFGKDVAKSFIDAMNPEEDAAATRRVTAALFNLVGERDEVYYVRNVPDPVTDPQILSVLHCYTGRHPKASMSFPGLTLSLKNINGRDKSRLVINVTAQ